jgi:hypothetical protein
MTAQITLDTAMELFDSSVTTRYQNGQRFANTIDERHGTMGTSLNVPVSDQIEMSQGNFVPNDIPVTAVDETNIVVSTNDYRVKTVIGGGQNTLFNYDKITTHAKLHAKAAARLVDYIRINAIFNSPLLGSIYTVPASVGVNTGINQGKMSDGMTQLEDNSVDTEDYAISMWSSATQKKAMQNDDRIVNFFYNDTKPLTNNRIQTYLDVDCRFVGRVGINRIPSTGVGPETFLIPLVHRDAIVQSFNRDIQTSITWVPQEDRWELLTVITTGAEIIQTNGIVLLTAENPFT